MSATCRQSGLTAALLVIVLFGLVSCGGGASSTRSSTSNRPLRLYRVRLTGKSEIPKGAAGGSGYAVIAIHRGSTVCWRFAHLHGFLDATVAQLEVGLSGRSGHVVQALSTGPRLRHRGCVPTSSAMVRAIELDPSNYYVDVRSKLYPAGAVRGQL